MERCWSCILLVWLFVLFKLAVILQENYVSDMSYKCWRRLMRQTNGSSKKSTQNSHSRQKWFISNYSTSGTFCEDLTSGDCKVGESGRKEKSISSSKVDRLNYGGNEYTVGRPECRLGTDHHEENICMWLLRGDTNLMAHN